MQKVLIVDDINKLMCDEYEVINNNYNKIWHAESEEYITSFLNKVFKGKILNTKLNNKDLLVNLNNYLVIFKNYKNINLPIMNRIIGIERLKLLIKVCKNISLQTDNKYVKRRMVALITASVIGGSTIVSLNNRKNEVKISNIGVVSNINYNSSDTPIKTAIMIDKKESEIEFLKKYSDKYSEAELEDFVYKYSQMNFYGYMEAINVLEKELPNNINNYSNLELAIMRTLTINAYKDGRLNGDIIPNELSYNEIEELALDYLRVYEKDDIYHKKLVLAILRLESGWGKDKNPVELNNYGNIRDNDGEYIKYKTSNLGVESTIRNILVIEEKAKNSLIESDRTTDNILMKTASIYAEDSINWYNRVSSIMNDVESDYNFSNQNKTNI